MPSKGLILVTGVNGYIAARTAEAFLQAGYSVRGTVRSKASAIALLKALSNYADRLEIVEVPDITAPDAFNEAVKNVHAIAHLASPVSMFFTDPEPVLHAAIEGTTNILESAMKESSLKSVVLMSSMAAVLTAPTDQDRTLTEANWNNWSEAIVAKEGKNTKSTVIYAASKAAAEKAFWKFRDAHKPGFTMTAINPSFVAGPPVVAPPSAEKINETILPIWRVLSGHDLAAASLPSYEAFADVRDVARMVLFGVEHAEQADGGRYIVAAAYAPPQAIADVLRVAYPERRGVIVEGTPGKGYLEAFAFPPMLVYDGRKAVEATGVDWIPFEKTILDTAEVLKSLL